MAVLTISLATGFSMEQLNLFDLYEHASESRSAVQYNSVDDASNFTKFNGAGLTYGGAFPNTTLTGGTISSIQDVQAGLTTFNLTGLALPAVTFFNFYTAADTGGFFANVLAGNDTVTGGAGNDNLFGFAGDDRINGGLGADFMDGGENADTYVVDNTGDVVDDNGTLGVDSVESSISFVMPQNIERLVLTGTAAINGTGRGGQFGLLSDIIIGNGAANVLDGGNGDDTLNGGLGNDVYVVDSFGDAITDTGGTDELRTYLNWFMDITPAIENMTLTGNAIRGTGNNLNNTITGNAFNNTLNGGSLGNDLLIGGLGDDTFADGDGDTEFSQGTNTYRGEAGNDLYFVETATDIVVELANEGYDKVISSLNNYSLTANVEELRLSTFSAVQNGNGNTLNNRLYGNNGDNTLDGKAGADLMFGQGGNDTYRVDDAGDRAIESTNPAGSLNDLVISSVSFRLAANIENLNLTGVAPLDGTGNNLANIINGNGAANVIDGREGADTMNGAAGNDIYFRDDFGDTITDTSGTDTVNVRHSGYTLEANLENLNIIGTDTFAGFGNALGNIITGNAAANSIEGNDGSDTLDGRGGSDTLNGGLGADKFRFTQLSSAFDNIADFVSGTDDIEVSLAAFGGGLALGAIAANLLVKASAPVASLGAGIGQFLYDTDDGRLFWDANGTTAGGITHFATLGFGVPPLAAPVAADFVVIA